MHWGLRQQSHILDPFSLCYAKNDLNQQEILFTNIWRTAPNIYLLTNTTYLGLKDPREGICGVPMDSTYVTVKVRF
jgi:hypothetical protein